MGKRSNGHPFPYYSDEHNGAWGGSIRADAENPGLDANTMSALAEDLDGDQAKIAEQVSGQITADVQVDPAKVSGQARQLAQDGLFAVALMLRFARDVDTFDGDIEHCNWLYRTRLAEAMRWAGRSAAATEDKADDKNVDEAHIGPSVKSEITKNEYATALGNLDTAAQSVSTDFGKSPAERNAMISGLIADGFIPLAMQALWPGVTLTDAQKAAYYKNALGNLSPEEQKQWILANKDHLDPAAAQFVAPEVQEYFAGQVAADIKDPDNIDAETVALMNFFKGETTYADALYTTVTPQDMSDAIVHLNSVLRPPGQSAIQHYTDVDPREFVKIYDGFMNAAGVTLATHSNSPNVDPNELANTWFNAITDEYHPANASALTLLIREGGEQPDGHFNATFIDSVASRSLEWEKQQLAEHPGEPVWGPRAGGLFIMDPDQDFNIRNVAKIGDQWTWTGGQGATAHDGMANLLAGMGHSPEGAQKFFMNDDGTVDQERLDYLMLHRTFSHEVGSDEGDGLGEALQAATIGGDPSSRDFDPKQADALTSNIFKIISENSSIEDKGDLGNKPYSGHLDGDTDNGWHLWENMSDSIGAIGAGYASDIYSEVGPGTGADSRLAGVDQKDILRVVAEIGGTHDQTGLTTLLAGVANAGVNHEVGEPLDQFLRDQQGPPPKPVDMAAFKASGMDLNTRNIGNTLGLLINASDDVYNDKEMTSAKRAEMAAKAFELGTSFLPGAGKVLGEGASEFAKTAYGTAQGELISRMQDAIKGEGAGTPATQAGSINDAISYSIANQFLQHGMLGEQADPNHGQTAIYPGVDAAANSLTMTNAAGQTVFKPDYYFDTDKQTDNPDWDLWVESTPNSTINDITGNMTDGLDAQLNQQLAHGNTQDAKD